VIFLDMQFWILRAVALLCFVVEAWAVINALRFSDEAYRAAGKRSKGFWAAITGISAVVGGASVFLGGGSLILQLVAVTAAGVFLADVLPALRRVWGRRQGDYGRGSRR
jgi:uncharacterized membrane protein YphA (DoxX/SURF4 family)